MKLIYVVGPYRAEGHWQVLENIRRAEALALEVWRLGAACICPHKNTAFFSGAAPDQLWLDGDLEMVRRCDALVCVPGWERSSGSRGEVALANELGIPVFQTTDELKQWMDEPASAEPVASASFSK
jgi:hypothetical protein